MLEIIDGVGFSGNSVVLYTKGGSFELSGRGITLKREVMKFKLRRWWGALVIVVLN